MPQGTLTCLRKWLHQLVAVLPLPVLGRPFRPPHALLPRLLQDFAHVTFPGTPPWPLCLEEHPLHASSPTSIKCSPPRHKPRGRLAFRLVSPLYNYSSPRAGVLAFVHSSIPISPNNKYVLNE